jgi:hypothetical protein
MELNARERFYIESLNATLNVKIPGRTQKEYRIDKNETIKIHKKKILLRK